MIFDDWQYIGSVNFNFDEEQELFLPYEFTSKYVGVSASTGQSNAKQTWIRAGYMTQYLDTDLGAVTTTVSRVVRFEPQIIEFLETPLFKVKFRPVPWILSINLAMFKPV